MINDLTRVQDALGFAWGGPVHLAAIGTLEGHERSQRLFLEQAPAGTPATVILKRAHDEYDLQSTDPSSPASSLFNIWASLEFMGEIFGEASPLPILYAGDRQAGWLVIEDLPEQDPLHQALWGSDPIRAQKELLRFMQMLGEFHAYALPQTKRYLELRQALGCYFPTVEHDPGPILQNWVHSLRQLGLALPAAALDEINDVAELLNRPAGALTLIHGAAVPNNLAETNGRLRLHDCEESHPRHALLEGVTLRMLFPSQGLKFVRRFPDAVWCPAEAAYRAILADVCPVVADDEAYARALTAASVFRALSGSLRDGPFSLQWALSAIDDPRVDHVRRVRLARYDAFVRTADEFDLWPNLRRYFSKLASSLRELWPGAADTLDFYPAFESGTETPKLQPAIVDRVGWLAGPICKDDT